MDGCKLKKDNNGYLVVTMPNGDVIPCQTELTIINNCDEHSGKVVIHFSCVTIIPIEEFEVLK